MPHHGGVTTISELVQINSRAFTRTNSAPKLYTKSKLFKSSKGLPENYTKTVAPFNSQQRRP